MPRIYWHKNTFGILAILGLVGFLSACDKGTHMAQRCTADFQPVCGIVQPTFCSLADCGYVEKTYDNQCMAQAESARIVSHAPCGMTPGAYVARAKFNERSPIFDRVDSVVNPYDPEILTALYQHLDGALQLESVNVEVTDIGVAAIVTGVSPEGCGAVESTQLVRLGDSFGVSVAHSGAEGCGGAMVAFTNQVLLDPGQNKFNAGQEYEIVVNGRIGRFTL